MMCKNINAIFLSFVLSATSLSAETVPDGFFGINDLQEVERRAGEAARGLPLFPILGDASAPVKIDYFYSASCAPCRQSSKSILQVLGADKTIQVSFHPLPANQQDYDAAVAETVLYSASPGTFSMFHFITMSSEGDDIPNSGKHLTEVAPLSGKDDVIWTRMENYRDWTTNLKVSRMIADELDISSLPTMVIGNRKYEGFVSHDAFLRVIEEVIEANTED